MTQANRRLDDWFQRYLIHRYGAFSKMAQTLITRDLDLLNTILSSLSNGIMEGTNTKIKRIKDVGLVIGMMPVSFYDFAWKLEVNFVIPDFWFLTKFVAFFIFYVVCKTSDVSSLKKLLSC